MKVLASVYACSPYDGSERAVGWNWLKELNEYHEITALTSYTYKRDIEDYLLKNPDEMKNVKFIYICKFCSNGTPILKSAVHSF